MRGLAWLRSRCTATLYFLWRGVAFILIPHLDGARLSLSNIVIAIVLALALAIGACLNFVGMAGPDALRRVIADLPSAYTMVINGAKEAAQVGALRRRWIFRSRPLSSRRCVTTI